MEPNRRGHRRTWREASVPAAPRVLGARIRLALTIRRDLDLTRVRPFRHSVESDDRPGPTAPGAAERFTAVCGKSGASGRPLAGRRAARNEGRAALDRLSPSPPCREGCPGPGDAGSPRSAVGRRPLEVDGLATGIPKRLRVRRHPERGHYDRQTVDAILDAGLVCHVAIVRDGEPLVLPTLYVRHQEALYLHGAVAATLLRAPAGGTPVAIAVTLLDGIVFARSVYNHSLNYRSVVILGRASVVSDPEEKLTALRALADRVQPQRWGDAREPNPRELQATRVLRVPIDEASAKIRTGPPSDDPEDMSRPVWAGVLPIRLVAGAPIPDPVLSPEIPLPPYLQRRGPDV